MITGFVNITKSMNGDDNFWELNPHVIYVAPFADLYTRDKTKDKIESSKHMWCVVWMVDPDEEVNKYYRLPKDQLIDTLLSYNKLFDPTDPDIEDCITSYPHLCMSADELAYKDQKDQLMEIRDFLTSQTITIDTPLETVEKIIKLKGLLSKVYQEFEKIEKSFIKTKTATRVFGQRSLNARERGDIQPDE